MALASCTAVALEGVLEFRVYKQYLHGTLKSTRITYIGLFGTLSGCRSFVEGFRTEKHPQPTLNPKPQTLNP